jgi:hypothetical protein
MLSKTTELLIAVKKEVKKRNAEVVLRALENCCDFIKALKKLHSLTEELNCLQINVKSHEVMYGSDDWHKQNKIFQIDAEIKTLETKLQYDLVPCGKCLFCNQKMIENVANRTEIYPAGGYKLKPEDVVNLRRMRLRHGYDYELWED